MKLSVWSANSAVRAVPLLALAVLVGCGGKPDTEQPSVQQETTTAQAQEEIAASEEERGQKHQPDSENGKNLFLGTCAPCHGEGGKGDGPAAAGLDPKPRDFTDKSIMSKLSDEHIAKTIRQGGAAVGKSPVMPAHPQFSDEEIADLVAYVRSLSE